MSDTKWANRGEYIALAAVAGPWTSSWGWSAGQRSERASWTPLWVVRIKVGFRCKSPWGPTSPVVHWSKRVRCQEGSANSCVAWGSPPRGRSERVLTVRVPLSEALLPELSWGKTWGAPCLLLNVERRHSCAGRLTSSTRRRACKATQTTHALA